MKRYIIAVLSAALLLNWAKDCLASGGFYPDHDYSFTVGDQSFGFVQYGDDDFHATYLLFGPFSGEVPLTAWQGWVVVASVPIVLLVGVVLVNGRSSGMSREQGSN
jgi:hypothetical protein